MNLCENPEIGVIGYGSWATALVSVITANGHHVNWYIRNREVLESVEKENINSKYLSDLELDGSRISASDDINEVVSGSGLLLMAMPSAYIKDFLSGLTTDLSGKFIVSAVKGIVPDEKSTVTQYLHKAYGVPYSNLGVISGPTHAEEVSNGRLTYITAACGDIEDAKVIGGIMGNSKLKFSYSDDVQSIEYAAVMKNIYAIAAGMASGLGYGDNFLSVLVSACAVEMASFLATVSLSGKYDYCRNSLGDLLVTCYSTYSRNRRLGLLIGRGCTVKSALNEMTMIAEGYFAADGLHSIISGSNLDMPIAGMVYDVLYNKANARKSMRSLAQLL